MTDSTICHLKFLDTDRERLTTMAEWFILSGLKIFDLLHREETSSFSVSLLGSFRELQAQLFRFAEEFSEEASENLAGLSFNPLQTRLLKQQAVELKNLLPDFSSAFQRPVISLGYLKNFQKPYSWFISVSEMKELLEKKDKTILKAITAGSEFLPATPLLFILKPLPIIVYIKAAIESLESIHLLQDKMENFAKKMAAGTAFPLIQFSYVSNDALTIATIAVKIVDYKKIPVHKALIFLYDQFDRQGIVPVEAEFGLPFPVEIFQTAIDELFSGAAEGKTPATELLNTLELFRFNITNIFDYPPMIIEKRFGIE